jgi:polysaccharide biosynthesis transport protein
MKSENNIPALNNGDLGAEAYFLPEGGRGVSTWSPPSASSGGMKINDIFFILFRHKWKILFFVLLGVGASLGAYVFMPHVYESQAKLLVRYVVDRSVVDNLDPNNNKDTRDASSPSSAAINSEIEILTSADIARTVVKAVGAEEILGGNAKPKGVESIEEQAVHSIFKSLVVKTIPDSNILFIVYQNANPDVAHAVLEDLLKAYFDKHLEVHRSMGGAVLISREAETLQKQLDLTAAKLKTLKEQAGVTSLVEDTTALANALSKTQEELDEASSELAAQRARVGEMQKLGVANQEEDENAPKKVHSSSPPSSEILSKYKGLIVSIEKMREDLTTFQAHYAPGSRMVKTRQAAIDAAVKTQVDLEAKYPALLEVDVATTASGSGHSNTPRLDPIAERAKLVELETKVATLGPRLADLKKRSAILAELSPKISTLQQEFEVQQANYKYYGATLEKAKLDERLSPATVPNIGVVESPSPSVLAKRDLKKIIPIFAGGGIAIGLVWALLIELVFDRTIKRAGDVEGSLRIPLLMSIPNFGGGALRLKDRSGDEEENEFSEQSEEGSLLQPFCEAIRDQLGLFFEMNQMSHKPKLIAVAGLDKKAGTSTLAAGLATALSEVSGPKKVCLVDKMVSPSRFYATLTQFKASDLDYVIFDMPPIGETSATASLAGFMDKLLLVVEAEKSTKAAIKKAYASLAPKVDVSVIFNKRRSYGPRWLEVEA